MPYLKLGNIIGHPTLGWDDTDFKIPEGVPAVYDGKWALNDVFTDGDYIYVSNRYTGVKTREYWIPTAASWFAMGVDNYLYVTLYDKHVAFKITK